MACAGCGRGRHETACACVTMPAATKEAGLEQRGAAAACSHAKHARSMLGCGRCTETAVAVSPWRYQAYNLARVRAGARR